MDGILIIFAPQFFPQAKDVALSIISAYKTSSKKKPLLICFVGAEKVRDAVKMLTEEGLPVYNTPEEAIKTFTYMYQYEKNIQLLFETPSTILENFKPDKEKVFLVLEKAFDEGRLVLSFSEALDVLNAYGIQTPPYEVISAPEEIIKKAQKLGFPLSLSLETQFSISEINNILEIPYQGIFSEDSLRLEYQMLLEKIKDLPHIKKTLILQSYLPHRGINFILGTRRSKILEMLFSLA